MDTLTAEEKTMYKALQTATAKSRRRGGWATEREIFGELKGLGQKVSWSHNKEGDLLRSLHYKDYADYTTLTAKTFGVTSGFEVAYRDSQYNPNAT